MAEVAFASNTMADSGFFRSHNDYSTNNNNTSSMPRSWFFETESSNGSAGGGELSPDYNEDIHLNSLRSAISSRNVTESVEVPSSEHVAEIVGRQGCKIKKLRAETNTYIKTPVRGEDPVFVITGKFEDVMDAKREIECASEHFTQIRASRRLSQGQSGAAPGHVTAYVRVPLRVVGLVVGPRGSTIKRIQQDTNTYIVTPSRCKEPVFEVTGLPQNVEAARREIEQHIYQRTGSIPITDQNITSISSYDLKAATTAAQVASANVSNRPNYGALAAGTHEMRRKAAWDSIVQAQDLIRQGQANGDYQAVATGTLSYNAALKKYHAAANAQQAAAKQLGVIANGGLAQNEYGQQQGYQNEYSMSGRTSPISLNGQHLGAIGSQQRAISPQQQMFGQVELMSAGPIGAASAPNSTRGSSPSGPVNSSQGSLHNPNQYKTWSNSSMSSSLNGDNVDSEKFRISLNALIGMFSNNCGMMNSGHSSCDEGLGESPTSSVNRLADDPYHLMMSSIWNDLDTTGSQLDKTLQAENPQFAV